MENSNDETAKPFHESFAWIAWFEIIFSIKIDMLFCKIVTLNRLRSDIYIYIYTAGIMHNQNKRHHYIKLSFATVMITHSWASRIDIFVELVVIRGIAHL